MKQLIEAIVRALVDKPDEVQIKEVIGEHAHVLELRVAKDDLGKVIGKGGAHASAIRTIMAAASGKEKKRYILEIIEYEGNATQDKSRVEFRGDRLRRSPSAERSAAAQPSENDFELRVSNPCS